MASPASDTELAFVLTFSYKILDFHKVASGSTQSRCPSPPSCLWAVFCLCPAPVLLKAHVRVSGTTQVRPQCPHLPTQPLLPGCMVLQHRVPCAQNIKSRVPHCEPCFVLGTHMPAVHILRFIVSHTRQFLQSLPAALRTLPLIRGQHESSITLRGPVQFSSCELTPSAGPQLTRPAWTRLLSVRAQGRTPTVGIHWGFLVNMLFRF